LETKIRPSDKIAPVEPLAREPLTATGAGMSERAKCREVAGVPGSWL